MKLRWRSQLWAQRLVCLQQRSLLWVCKPAQWVWKLIYLERERYFVHSKRRSMLGAGAIGVLVVGIWTWPSLIVLIKRTAYLGFSQLLTWCLLATTQECYESNIEGKWSREAHTTRGKNGGNLCRRSIDQKK